MNEEIKRIFIQGNTIVVQKWTDLSKERYETHFYITVDPDVSNKSYPDVMQSLLLLAITHFENCTSSEVVG